MSSKDNKDEPSSNPFVQFKHHVDSSVSHGLNTMIGNERGGPGGSSVVAPSDDYQPSVLQAFNLGSVLFSPYSPAALRHLPRPVPNDLPEHVEADTFTFEDAFEDLLAVSQGQGLPDMTQKLQQKQLLRQMFPDGEPFWFWYRRLRSSGLLRDRITDRHLADRSNWDAFHEELERRAEDVWGYAGLGALQAARAIGNIWEEIERSVQEQERHVREKGSDSRQETYPDTYNELFESVQSAFNSGQRSWDAFMKIISEGQGTNDQAHGTGTESQNKVLEDRNEYVDKFGYVHSKVTRKEVDKDGNEVSSSTSYQVYPASKDKAGESHEILDNTDDDKKSGWFWK